MSLSSLQISAPGSIMITGEHAVVYGHPAIVAAVEQRMHVVFTPRQDRLIEVHSQLCEPQSMTIDEAEAVGPLRYVFGAVALYKEQLSHGLTISITSEIDPTLGLGSSAAITVAMMSGLMAFSQMEADKDSPDQDPLSMLDFGLIHSQALALVRKVQGRGSGADLAASLNGGMISYQLPQNLLAGSDATTSQRAQIEQLPNPPEMSLCYCGYKTPTGEVLAKIAERMVGKEAQFEALYARMGVISHETIKAIQQGDWEAFAHKINLYQDLMSELGVSDPVLDKLIDRARQSDNVTCAKISGSGLGDCIVAFGARPPHHNPANLAMKGVMISALQDDQ